MRLRLRSSRRPPVSSSTSRAPIGCGTPPSYEAWYGFTHPRPGGLGDWVYGLTELVAESGRLVANPGCYATATLLALAPLKDAIEPGSVVVDGLSGMTGAGRTLKASTHAGAVLENVAPYRVGAHQHVPEITQLLGFPVSFTPHLLPVRRGLIATCNVRSTGADLRALLEEAYAGSPVVTVLPEGMAPELARVQHSDRAEIGVFDDRFTDRTIVICAEDNLGKGAAGQAIQNVNRALGLEPTAGLRLGGVTGLAMSVTAAQGFEASGVSAGIRPSGRPDVAVVRSVPAAVGAALWTTNRVQAAPVTVSKRHLALAEPQAVLINAGVANAATGAQGEEDAVASAVGLAGALGLEPEQVLVLSTGVIGAAAAARQGACRGAGRCRRALGRGWRCSRSRDPDDRLRPEGRRRASRRLHRRRHGEGRRA